MKTTLKMIIGSLVLSSVAYAGSGPDFVGAPARAHIDRSLVASSGTNPIEPGDVVPFAFNTAQLTDSGYAQVDRAALWLKVHPRENIVLEGQASPPGSEGYNVDLSMLRAEAIRARLLANGISRSRIIMVASGEREQLLSPPEQQVRMYSTKLAPQVIYAMTHEDAKWMEPIQQTARR
jgi:outer membrane protein OmpA-like peptidoglycan-associated protein